MKIDDTYIEGYYHITASRNNSRAVDNSKKEEYVNPFKLGDRVISLVDEDCYITRIRKGEVGTVIRIYYKSCDVLFDRADINWQMNTVDLQPTGEKIHVCPNCRTIGK